jgi:hypothetical protein
MAYKLVLWRWLKKSGKDAGNPLASLSDIPADAEMDEGIVLGCWNGERFVSWKRWLATVPLDRAPDSEPPSVEPDTDCVHAVCDSTPEIGPSRQPIFGATLIPHQRNLPSLSP